MDKRERYDLETIASNYHLARGIDMHIENAMQEFEWPWIQNLIEEGSSILDLGYGDGISLRNLVSIRKEMNLSITLLEGAPTLVLEAQTKSSKDDVEVVSTYFEDFKRLNTYDFIIASHVLEHVDAPSELLNILFENAKVGATLVGIVPNKNSIHRQLAVLMGLQEKLDDLSQRDLLVGHQRVYGAETLSKLFEESKWELVALKGFFLKPLSNLQMVDFSPSLIGAFFRIAEELPVEICANIGFIARKVE